MVKKGFMAVYLVMISVMVIFLFGCVTNVGVPNISSWSKEVTSINSKDGYTILGPVFLEKASINVFGFLGNGGVIYADLLKEAQRLYRGVDAVIYANVEKRISNYMFLITRIEYVITGIAINYKRGTVASDQVSNNSNSQNFSSYQRICTNCKATFNVGNKCPNCGHVIFNFLIE